MRYLKKYNEGISSEDLQEFCESSLAYLIDVGFSITIFAHGSTDFWISHLHSTLPKGHFTIWLKKNNGIKQDFFKWDDVKDYYIPFIQLLSNRYVIGGFSTGLSGQTSSASNIRFRYRKKEDYSFVNINKDFSYIKVINDDVFDSEGYWKDHIYYKWVPDPDIIAIGILIVESNQIKFDI